MKKEYKTALVVGRFQPFHKGHLYLMKKALVVAEKVVVAIGSANSSDVDANPLSFSQRKKLIDKVIEHEGWSKRVGKIVPSNDYESDNEWFEELINSVGKFDVALGNNEWTNSVLEKAGYKVMSIPLKKREVFQGVNIRKLIRSDKEWKGLVPKYLVEEISKSFLV